MDRSQAEKMVGKRTPLPGAGKPAGQNWAPKPEPAASSGKSGIGALPADYMRNPKAIIADREKKAGLACGGKVKKHAQGGLIKGAGAATRGKKFNVW